MVALNGEPGSYAAAVSGALASATMDSADFTLAAGATSGRRLLVSAQNDIAVTASGTADHVALLDPANSRLLYVNTCAPQALTSGGRSEEHTSELQSLMRITYAVFCLKKKKNDNH